MELHAELHVELHVQGHEVIMSARQVVNQGGAPVVEVEDMGNSRRVSPVEISSMVLAHMKDIAQTFLGIKVTDAVSHSESFNVRVLN